MKTKLFSLLFAVAASVGTMFAESGTCGENLTWDLTNGVLTISGTGAMVDYDYYDDVPWYGNRENISQVVINDGVTSIGDGAFAECSNLTSVTIPNSVTSIGVEAFDGCTGLPVENNLRYADTYLVEAVDRTLSSYTIKEGTRFIGSVAFLDCSGLTSVTIPNSVTSIGEGAFYDCSGLTSVTIPNSVTSIDRYAFAECSGLTSVTIPNSVTSIGTNVFQDCSSLTSIDVATDNPNYSSSGGVLFNKGKTTLVAYPGGKQGAYTIPNSVTSIVEYAFYGCNGLTSVTIGNSVTSIGEGAFADCRGLTSVTIGNSVTSIGGSAFYRCDGLTLVTIGNSVTSIGAYAFCGCRGLTSVYNYSPVPQVIDNEVFGGEEFEVDGGKYGPVDKSICKLYVPQESIDLYKAAEGWKDFKNILPIGAQTVDVTTTTVTPSATTADIAWPQVSGAASYELVIKDKDGNIVCTLVFDAEGRLTSINFAAPGKDHNRKQTQTAGFAFSITGLESGTTYNYTLTAKDNNGKVLSTETGTFTTEGGSSGEQGVDEVQSDQVQSTKVIRDGQLFILRGEKVFTATGIEVR